MAKRTQRPKLPPLYLRREPKRDAYVHTADILAAVHADDVSRIIQYNGLTRSVQQRGGGWLKPIDGFAARHSGSEDTWTAFLEECVSRGVRMPSSYADVFMRLFRPPRVRWSINRLFYDVFTGPWEEARARGLLPGIWRQYDLNRAYQWAASLGLPDVATFRASDRVAVNRPGMYTIHSVDPDPMLPHPFNRGGWIMASDAEIETYSLRWDAILGGVTWNATLPGDACLRIMQSLSFGDEVAKSFWGLWAARNPVQTYFPNCDKIVMGRSIYLNLVWAHFIVGNIKRRVWEDSKNAAHVFCDSIITRDRLPTSQRVGGWKLVTEFPNGVYIEGAGRYGYDADNLLKHAGTPGDKWDTSTSSSVAPF